MFLLSTRKSFGSNAMPTRQQFMPNAQQGLLWNKEDESVLYTFTSPMYPNNYLANIDCIKIIRAPKENQQIVLDFRGPFLFEPSIGCINDYLEVRDGEYGFSPLIGRFCQDTHRLHPIRSSGQWLRLHFHSDFSIEKPGFQALYYFTTIDQDIIISKFIVSSELVLTRQHLLLMWNNYVDTKKLKTKFITKHTEFVIDVQTREESDVLVLHVNFIKFYIMESNCKTNMAQIFDEYFLDKPNFFSTSLDRTMLIKFQAQKNRMWTNLKFKSPPIQRICNTPTAHPYVHKLGRSVFRILLLPESQVNQVEHYSMMDLELTNEMLNNRSNRVANLPKLKLVATVLKKALCSNNWIPCVRPSDYVTYKNYFNLTVRSSVKLANATPDSNRLVNDLTQNIQSGDKQAGATLNQTKNRQFKLNLPIYCIAPELVCNGYANCPNGEDEDTCPRPAEGLEAFDVFYSEKKALESTSMADPNELTTPNKTTPDSTDPNDEFQHHTPIIASLLGFCAMCGLVSAGMTFINRTKHMPSQPSLGKICNRLLFDSTASLMTVLESYMAPNIKSTTHLCDNDNHISEETNKMLVDDFIGKNHKRKTPECLQSDHKLKKQKNDTDKLKKTSHDHTKESRDHDYIFDKVNKLNYVQRAQQKMGKSGLEHHLKLDKHHTLESSPFFCATVIPIEKANRYPNETINFQHKIDSAQSDPYSLQAQGQKVHVDGCAKDDKLLHRSVSVHPIYRPNVPFAPHIVPNESNYFSPTDYYHTMATEFNALTNRKTNIFSIKDVQTKLYLTTNQTSSKRKHFKGGAPKRAKQEDGLSLSTQFQNKIKTDRLHHYVPLSMGPPDRHLHHNSFKLHLTTTSNFDSHKPNVLNFVPIEHLSKFIKANESEDIGSSDQHKGHSSTNDSNDSSQAESDKPIGYYKRHHHYSKKLSTNHLLSIRPAFHRRQNVTNMCNCRLAPEFPTSYSLIDQSQIQPMKCIRKNNSMNDMIGRENVKCLRQIKSSNTDMSDEETDGDDDDENGYKNNYQKENSPSPSTNVDDTSSEITQSSSQIMSNKQSSQTSVLIVTSKGKKISTQI